MLSPKVKLSAIIPTLNEEQNSYYFENLKLLSRVEGIEVIICDGGSDDRTIEKTLAFGFKPIGNAGKSRAKRLNVGIEHISGEMVLLIHPRTLISQRQIDFLLNFNSDTWGTFVHSFDRQNVILQFTSWYSNYIRTKLKGIVYLDHCLFIQKELARKVFPIPEVDIFEDTLISMKLNKLVGLPELIPLKSVTSALRFERNGIIRQCLLNQLMKIAFYLNIDHQFLNRIYEKKLELNTKYKK